MMAPGWGRAVSLLRAARDTDGAYRPSARAKKDPMRLRARRCNEPDYDIGRESLAPKCFGRIIVVPRPGDDVSAESWTQEEMTTTRKQYSPKFKARVAIEAIRGGA